MHRISTIVVLACCLGLAAGCAGRQKVDVVNSDNVIDAVKKGDIVRITTVEGFQTEFVLTKITNKALYGDEQRILYTNMRKVEVKDGNRGSAEDMTNAFKGLF